MAKAIHMNDAIRLLETGRPVDLKVWKLSDGSIIEYRSVVCIGGHWRRGTHRIRILRYGLIREFRDITLFEINNMNIYL